MSPIVHKSLLAHWMPGKRDKRTPKPRSTESRPRLGGGVGTNVGGLWRGSSGLHKSCFLVLGFGRKAGEEKNNCWELHAYVHTCFTDGRILSISPSGRWYFEDVEFAIDRSPVSCFGNCDVLQAWSSARVGMRASFPKGKVKRRW